MTRGLPQLGAAATHSERQFVVTLELAFEPTAALTFPRI